MSFALKFTSAVAFLSCVLLCSLSILTVPAQQFPSKIRGYKVHPDRIIITNGSGTFAGEADREAAAQVGQPRLADVSITGIKIAVSVELSPVEHSGDVHLMTFRDFKVNDIPVEVAEYREAFSFKKNEKIVMPKAATIFIPANQILNAAWSEISGSKKEWTVTGRVLVFGKFRRLGFSFKRVVPVEVKLTINNPMHDLATELSS